MKRMFKSIRLVFITGSLLSIASFLMLEGRYGGPKRIPSIALGGGREVRVKLRTSATEGDRRVTGIYVRAVVSNISMYPSMSPEFKKALMYPEREKALMDAERKKASIVFSYWLFDDEDTYSPVKRVGVTLKIDDLIKNYNKKAEWTVTSCEPNKEIRIIVRLEQVGPPIGLPTGRPKEFYKISFDVIDVSSRYR